MEIPPITEFIVLPYQPGASIPSSICFPRSLLFHHSPKYFGQQDGSSQYRCSHECESPEATRLVLELLQVVGEDTDMTPYLGKKMMPLSRLDDLAHASNRTHKQLATALCKVHSFALLLQVLGIVELWRLELIYSHVVAAVACWFRADKKQESVKILQQRKAKMKRKREPSPPPPKQAEPAMDCEGYLKSLFGDCE